MAKRPEAERRQEAPEPAGGNEPKREHETRESDNLEVGTVIEVTRLDGGVSKDVLTGHMNVGGKNYHVYARTTGNEVRLRFVEPEEVAAREVAAQQLDLFEDVYESDVDKSIQILGLDGDEAEAVRAQLINREAENIAAVIGEKNPEKAVVELIEDQAKSEEEKPRVDLAALELEYANLRKKADEAYDAGDEKLYAKYTTKLYALDKQKLEARLAENPNASKQEKAVIADQVEGFVQPLPDAIYDEGLEAVQNRIAQLEQDMDKANETRNGVAYLAAEDERKRHMVMLPLLERVEGIKQAEDEVAALVADAETKHKAETQRERSQTRSARSYWRNVGKKLQSLLRQTGEEMEKLEETAVKGGYKEDSEKAAAEHVRLEESRKGKILKLAEVQNRVEELNAQNEALKSAKVELDFDEHEKVDSAQTALYGQLKEMYKQNPDQVMTYVDRALKNTSTAESTRVILDLFRNEQKRGLFEPEIESKQKPESEPIIELGDDDFEDITQTHPSLPELANDHETAKKTSDKVWEALFDADDANYDDERWQTGNPKDASVDDQDVTPSPLAATRQPVAEAPHQPISSADRKQFKDLVEAGVLREGEDLATWEKSFVEVLIALEALGLKPKDEGLPESFQDVVQMKDKRGMFGKLLGKKTDRLQMFEKIGDLHYQLIDSGKVNISEYLARQKKTYNDYASQNKNIGSMN